MVEEGSYHAMAASMPKDYYSWHSSERPRLSASPLGLTSTEEIECTEELIDDVGSPPFSPPQYGSFLGPLQMQQAQSRVDKIASLLQYASSGKVDAVREILDEGLVDVDSADYDKRTALHLAASEGNYGVVELLLSRNAKVNPVDRFNDTPLQDAVKYVKGDEEKRREYHKVQELLVQQGGKETKPHEQAEANEELDMEEQGMLDQLQEDYEIERDELNWNTAKVIGKGSYGEVYLVNWRGTKVAAKMILQNLAQREEVKKEFRMELLMLQSLRHPNIVEFLGAVTRSSPLVIVTEYLANGDLHEIIQRRGRIHARDAVGYALDIARGMNYLHQHKPRAIVHRDLKPRNLLQDEAGHLKVADFGLSKLLEPKPKKGVPYHMTGGTGTYRYMAPEVYLHQNYDKSVDVFSFGIIVQEMFEGGTVLLSSPGQEVAQARAQTDKRPVFFAKTYPPQMKELLRKCWDKEPAVRPTFEEIIKKLEGMFQDLRTTSRWAPKPMITGVVGNVSATWNRWLHQQNELSRAGYSLRDRSHRSHRGGGTSTTDSDSVSSLSNHGTDGSSESLPSLDSSLDGKARRPKAARRASFSAVADRLRRSNGE